MVKKRGRTYLRRSRKKQNQNSFLRKELFDLFIFEGEGGNPKLCISMDFFIIINPSVLTHTHTQKSFLFCTRHNLRHLSEINGRTNVIVIPNIQMFILIFSPPSFLYFYYCLLGDIISRTCLFIILQRLLFSGTGAYYVVTRWNSNNLPPRLEVFMGDNERNHIVFCWH